MMRWSLLLLIVFLSACGQGGLFSGDKANEKKASSQEPKIPEVPSFLRAGQSTANVSTGPSRKVQQGVDPASLDLDRGGIAGLPSEADIVFTDPDNPEASEEAISRLLKEEKKDWFESYTLAKNEALLQGKPLLMVFTATQSDNKTGSPFAIHLEQELLARDDFNQWAEEHFVRLKLDYTVKGTNSVNSEKLTLALKKEKYLKFLKKRYKINGFPSLLVLAADGSIIQKKVGYRPGDSEYTWGLLRTALVLSEEKQKGVEDTLKKKGYRRWKGTNGKKILARLARYKEGALTLITPSGVRFETKESNLSDEDREWIEQEKTKRSALRGS